MKRLLLPLTWLYGLAVVVRNFAYDKGWLRVESAGVPVISVGNVTAGGTGKTPLVEFLVRHLVAMGKHPAILSRGFHRQSHGLVIVSDGKGVRADAATGGDEPVQMAQKLGTVPVVVAERRIEAARVAVRDLHADVLVLDDGFQHRSLKRDLNILVMDARKNVVREPLLPMGLRREPLSAMKRADLVVFSKMDPATESVPWLEGRGEMFHGDPILTRMVPAGIYLLEDHRDVGPAELLQDSALAFSGIADHAGFVQSLLELGVSVVEDVRFPDHHVYERRDIARLANMLRTAGAALFVTTEKDAVRIEGDPELRRMLLETAPAYVATIEIEVFAGAERLSSAVDACVEGGGR